MMEESSADRNQHLAHLEAQNAVTAHRDLLPGPKGSVKHNAVSKSLLKEGVLAYHIIAACIIIITPRACAARGIYMYLLYT